MEHYRILFVFEENFFHVVIANKLDIQVILIEIKPIHFQNIKILFLLVELRKSIKFFISVDNCPAYFAIMDKCESMFNFFSY